MQADVPLLSVLLVDDEPYIRKGIAASIDWEAEGYYIAGETSNGKNAIQLLKERDYNLIISDIKMPEMDGVELINYVKSKNMSKGKFVFVSGFYDFQYAKTAIQCGCCDYILKPIQTEELLSTIRKIMEEYQKEAGSEKNKRAYEKAYLERNLSAVVWGKYDSINLKYVIEKMSVPDEVAYIHCEISLNDEKFKILSEEHKKAQHRKLYYYTGLMLKNYSNHVIYDLIQHTQCYGIGIIYCSNMAKEKELTEEEWLKWLLKELSERVGFEVVACMGTKVCSIKSISDSFREAVMLRSFKFYKKNHKISNLYKSDSASKNQVDDYFRRQLDELIHATEINDKVKIRENASALYRSMMGKEANPEIVSRNIQYLLYRLLGLAYDQDADINQEEIMQYIREAVFSSQSNHGNELKFQQFTVEYSDYLMQLRQNTAKGTICQIKGEIEENYADNISLKSLGDKYYINSAYLGQVFKKQFGCSFKDYLNAVRVRKAAELMLGTSKMICEIAIDVGYKNQEYFINKFEDVYGVTPARFRKRNLKTETVL